ncbi:lysoplasmalogenase family protein [Herbivorax sp. ANBcel31]|uniref:lysoplasmalogenase family protein n=1 Tax=Herbivorax sp. ANBcel31 TaxID=3069754 RepID=UPI0027B0E668|nr:lysoplasmalogenase family protein [Herbivorax sp. ANBcel31]MDQ2088089.1 lysoplasmalogenase family protein [Herbivorax sp. ANBcel31]
MNKKATLKAILIAIFLVLLYFVTVNVYYLFFLQSVEGHAATNLLKRIIPLLCTIIVFLTGSNKINKKDATFLKISYLMILGAEISFIFDEFILGVAFFGLCQIFLSIRHYAGISDLPKVKEHSQKIKHNKKFLFISGTVIALVVTVLITTIYYPPLGMNTIFYSIIIYGIILGISLWISIANYYIGSFPKKNALMIMIGMTLFFVSDILVGLEVIIEDTYNKNILNLFLWLLYAPAITLIALSGYKSSNLHKG